MARVVGMAKKVELCYSYKSNSTIQEKCKIFVDYLHSLNFNQIHFVFPINKKYLTKSPEISKTSPIGQNFFGVIYQSNNISTSVKKLMRRIKVEGAIYPELLILLKAHKFLKLCL